MVSGTRCPAGSDPVKRWSESRAAAPKGRCPVEHKGEFPDVLACICLFIFTIAGIISVVVLGDKRLQ